MSVADLQDDAEFQALSPDAKAIVVDRMSQDDADFRSLSPQAQDIVRQRLTGAQRAQVRRQPTGATPEARTPEPLAPYLADSFKKGVSGLVALPGLAVDAANLPLKAFDYASEKVTELAGGDPSKSVRLSSDYPFMGSQNLYEGASRLLGVKDLPTPKNEYGRPSKSNEYLGKLAEFAGASVLPGIGVVSAAERKLLAAMVEIAATAISATGAVEGKELGRTLAPKMGVDPMRAEMMGELLGSLAGPGVAGAAARGIERGTARGSQFVTEHTGMTGLSREAQQRAGQALATRQLRESLEAAPGSQANLANAVELQNRIPGFRPTLGEASGAPGVIAIEERIAGSSPQDLAAAAARREENVSAIQDFSDRTFPQPAAGPTDAARTRYTARAEQLSRQREAVDEQIRRLSELDGVDNAAIGTRLRQLRDEAQSKARAQRNALYDDVYLSAERANVTENVSDIRDIMRQVAGSDENAAQIMPALYADLSQAIKKYEAKPSRIQLPEGVSVPRQQGVIVPFAALHSMSKRAGEDSMRAVMAGDMTRAYHIAQVRDAINAKLAKFEGAEYGDVAEKLRTANRFHREKYAPVFQEGLGGRMVRFNRFGDTTADEEIVRKLIFTPGGQRGMSEFFDIYGTNPEAAKLLENGVMDMFAKAAVRDGEIKTAALQGFIRQHKAQLDAMPAVRNRLRSIESANEALLSRREAIQAQQKKLDRTAVAKIAKTENVDEVVEKALTDRRTMQALTSQAARNPQASQAVARAIADAVSAKPDPYAYIQANAPMLRQALKGLGSEHFDNLLTISKAESTLGRVRVPSAVNLERLQDIGEQAVGTSVKGLFSRMLNVKKGYMSGGYAAFDVGGRYIYKIKAEEAHKLMKAAIYDPELAKVLAQAPRRAPQETMNSLRNHAISHGIRVLAVERAEAGE